MIHTILLALAFLILFAFAEILYHQYKVPAETTRKVVHVVTGLLTLLFPVWIGDAWWVLFLCGSFFALLLCSQFLGWFPSIHAVNRKTVGGLMFPIVVYGCFLLYIKYQEMYFFYIPILILSISDTCAEMVGKKWPLKKYTILGSVKSLGGSLAFFISASAIGALFLMQATDVQLHLVFVYSILIALLSTITEAISGRGLDNLTVPFVAAGVLVILRTFDLVHA